MAQHLGKAVEGDARIQMVHVVDADIAGQPAQGLWQHIMRAAL